MAETGEIAPEEVPVAGIPAAEAAEAPAPAENSGQGDKAAPKRQAPPALAEQGLANLAVVEHMTYALAPADPRGINVRLEGVMSARQLAALRQYLDRLK